MAQSQQNAFWSPLVVVPASEVRKVENGTDTLLAWGTFTLYSAVSRTISGDTTGSVWASCGPHLLWEIRPDTPVLKVGHCSYLFCLTPQGAPGVAAVPSSAPQVYYKVILGAGTTPEALGALEAVLEEAAPYSESSKLVGAAGATELAAAAAAQQRVAADRSSQASATPPGEMRTRPGNPFAPDAGGAGGGAAAAAAGGGGGGAGNPFGGGPPPPQGVRMDGGGGVGQQPAAGMPQAAGGAEYTVEAQIWNRQQQQPAQGSAQQPGGPQGPAQHMGGAPPPPSGTRLNPTSQGAPPPPLSGRQGSFVGGPPPSVAAAQGQPCRLPPTHPSQDPQSAFATAAAAGSATASGGPAGGGVVGRQAGVGSVGSQGSGGGAPPPPSASAGSVPGGPYSSKKANKFLAYTDKLAGGVLQKSSSFLQKRSTSTEQLPPESQGSGGAGAEITARLSSAGGWAAGKLRGASSWAGAAAAKKLGQSDPAHPKRGEIADAAGRGLANVFEAMERACVGAVPTHPTTTTPGPTAPTATPGAAPGVGAGVGAGYGAGPAPNVGPSVGVGVQKGAPWVDTSSHAQSHAPQVSAHEMPPPTMQQAQVMAQVQQGGGGLLQGPAVQPVAVGVPVAFAEDAQSARRLSAKQDARSNLHGYL